MTERQKDVVAIVVTIASFGLVFIGLVISGGPS